MLERLQGSRAALDESVRAQRQLVADASHELRTPITSLRTNIEVLLAGGQLDRGGPPAAARRRGRAERGAERADRRPDRARPRRPAARASVEDVAPRPHRRGVARARPPRPPRDRTSRPRCTPVIVEGVPERLGRAVNNLLDNAARHSPPRRRSSRSPSTPTACACATTAPAIDEADLPVRVRPLLPRHQQPRPPGQRTGPGDRAPGRRAARRRRSTRPTLPTAARSSRCTSRRSAAARQRR